VSSKCGSGVGQIALPSKKAYSIGLSACLRQTLQSANSLGIRAIMIAVRALLLLLVALLFAGAVQAGDLEDGYAAYDRKDYTTALEKFRIWAQQGSASAQFSLGFMYDNGEGVAQDYAEAARWYKLAAAQGDAIAQYNLALKFKDGRGVVQDYAEAVRWYKLAAAQGVAYAHNNLGFMYGAGRGVTQDYVKSHMWYNLAAVNGDGTAVKNRDIIAANMTPQQIAEAQKLARECQARKFKNCD